MKTGGEVTLELADTPARERGEELQRLRSLYYQYCVAADPKAVEEYERRVEERRKRP